jgi:pimeloyl-ACP methyl ester carboxylesterase
VAGFRAPTKSRPFAVSVTGHGPAMILIPGLASAGEVWASTVEHERDHYTCHVLTLPGFAGQPRIAAPMLAAVREAIAEYIADARLDHPIIVGHSLGGFLALDLAERHPELVGPLVVVDSLPFLPAAWDPSATVETARAGAAAVRARMLGGSPEARRENNRATVTSMVSDPASQATVLAWMTRSDPEAVVDAMIEMTTTDLRPALDMISARTLVIGTWRGWPTATREQVTQTFQAQYARLRGMQLAITDTARHFVMLDDPAFLFGRMDAFLDPARSAER